MTSDVFFNTLKTIIARCKIGGEENRNCEIDPRHDSLDRYALAELIRRGHIKLELLPAIKLMPAQQTVHGSINLNSNGGYGYSGGSGGTFSLPLPPPDYNLIPEVYTWWITVTEAGYEASFAEEL